MKEFDAQAMADILIEKLNNQKSQLVPTKPVGTFKTALGKDSKHLLISALNSAHFHGMRWQQDYHDNKKNKGNQT